MVEFSDVAAAKNAKEVLQDKDIYDGCNTIKVEYARTQKLNVYKVSFEGLPFSNLLTHSR